MQANQTLLSKENLSPQEQEQYTAVQHSPITILQIGEGNFLRGFVDWMIAQCRAKGLYQGAIAVTQPRPSGKAKIEKLNAQDQLYTLVIRGLEKGERVEERQVMNVFASAFDPYSQWEKLLELAERPELEFVVSNTTEAGLSYKPEELREGQPIQSFPGKLAYFLYKRYLAFEGAADKGLIMLPTELLERNGDELKRCVLQFSRDWGLPEAFIQWVEAHNRFLNSLVDRIVTGYPAQEAENWFAQWGYRDELLNTAEPYHLWAIEGEPQLDERLPLQQAGLNVHWVDDLRPYQQRKVRLLNGSHTLMTPIALLHGLRQVREVMEHEQWGAFVREAAKEEIIPATPLDSAELAAYSETVFERFLNPYIEHRLADIAMNSISKFKARLLPSLQGYHSRYGKLPERIVQAFAALLLLYKVRKTEEGWAGTDLTGQTYLVRDDEQALAAVSHVWAEAKQGQTAAETAQRLLALTDVWGQGLAAINGLAERLGDYIEEMERSRHE